MQKCYLGISWFDKDPQENNKYTGIQASLRNHFLHLGEGGRAGRMKYLVNGQYGELNKITSSQCPSAWHRF